MNLSTNPKNSSCYSGPQSTVSEQLPFMRSATTLPTLWPLSAPSSVKLLPASLTTPGTRSITPKFMTVAGGPSSCSWTSSRKWCQSATKILFTATLLWDQHLVVVVLIFGQATTATPAILHGLISPQITTWRAQTNTQTAKPATLPCVEPPMAITSKWQNTRCSRWSSSDRDPSSHFLSYPSSILKIFKMIFPHKATLATSATNSLVGEEFSKRQIECI